MTATSSYDVVIVTHNHASTLRACLRAVAGLTSVPKGIIIVDNASQDDSVAIARSALTDAQSLVIGSSTNEGFAAGMNRGIAASTADWVLLLNPDCALEHTFIERLFAAIRSQGNEAEIGAATGLLMRADGPELKAGRTVDSAGMIMTPGGRHLDRGAGSQLMPAHHRPAWVFGGTGAATLYRKAALADVCYPDGQIFAESFFAYREDAELAWRLQWRGWRCLYWPEATGAHQRGFRPESGRRGHEAINLHSVRNRFLLRLHCADMSWHLWRFPWWAVRDLLVVAACLTVERSSRTGLRQAWTLRREALSRRRHVMDTARTSSRQMRRWFRIGEWVEEIDR